jgi:hypothetical protein
MLRFRPRQIFRTLRRLLTLRPVLCYGLRVHRRALALAPRHIFDVAEVANPRTTLVLPRVPLIVPEPVNVAVNRSALPGVAQKPFFVARRVVAVLLDVPCVLINSVVVARPGGCRERDCRSNGHYSESYNAVDVGRSTSHVFPLMFIGGCFDWESIAARSPVLCDVLHTPADLSLALS